MQHDHNSTPVTTALGGIQWLFFMFANIVVIPISIGQAFHLAPAVVTASLERAFIYTGIACILQGTVGHRLPLMEGPAGLWWGVILGLAASIDSSGQSLQTLGGNLEVGIIVSDLLRATQILGRAPFLIGAALFILLGAVPALGQLFASLPISVGDAVLFVAYLQLFGSALDTIKGMVFSYKTIYRLATPVLFGLALMTVPPSAFNSIPAVIRTLLENGLVMGIALAMIMEHAIRWDKQAKEL